MRLDPQYNPVVSVLTLFCLLSVFLFSIWELARHGLDRDYPFLFLGSLVSGIVVFYRSRRVREVLSDGRLGPPVGLGGLIPVFFGLYLLFYRGLWRFSELSEGFTWVIVIKALCFIGVGAVIASGSRWMNQLISSPGSPGEGGGS
ncbi:MAG TPA: hypothetical protein VIU33_01240 [Nitrospiria bacterium]